MNSVPEETIRAFARTIVHESRKYGFGTVDTLRLINTLMDLNTHNHQIATDAPDSWQSKATSFVVTTFPLRSGRLQIRQANHAADAGMIQSWSNGTYGQHFLLSCATSQSLDVSSLLMNPDNQIGVITLPGDIPIGVVAFLDINHTQRRAELRKLIGVSGERGKGYAEEATALWIEYGRKCLGLEKVYLSTLQTHLRNIKLNESVGFRVEGILRGEVLLGTERHDVLRMGLCFE